MIHPSHKEGSILIFALIAVFVTSLLTIGLSKYLRSEHRHAKQHHSHQLDIQKCHAAIEQFTTAITPPEKTSQTALINWSQPFIPEDDPSIIIASQFQSDPTEIKDGPTDEESRISLNGNLPGALSVLIHEITRLPTDKCKSIEEEINALGEIHCPEQIRSCQSVTPELYNAIRPFITSSKLKTININTAPPVVLKALFSVAKSFDEKAADSLARKLYAFKSNGGHFQTCTPEEFSSKLGGLSITETLILNNAVKYLTVDSNLISGAAYSPTATILFTYNIKEQRIERITIL